MTSRHKKLIGLLVIPAILLLPLIYLLANRLIAVANLQNSLTRNWEIEFNTDDFPRMLPASINSAASWFIESFFSSTSGTSNIDLVYDQRFISLFRGPIHKILIYYPKSARGDIGAALRSFPELQEVSLMWSPDDSLSQPDWKRFCAQVRLLSHLQTLEISGDKITDASILPLSGHPELRSLTIDAGRITAESAKTFGTLPKLRELRLDSYGSDTRIVPPADQKALQEALPAVHIEFD